MGFAERDVVNSSDDEKLDRILFVADVLKISRQEVCSDREYWRVPLEHCLRPRYCVSVVWKWHNSLICANNRVFFSPSYLERWSMADIAHAEPDRWAQFSKKLRAVHRFYRNAQVGSIRDLQCLFGNSIGSLSSLGGSLHFVKLPSRIVGISARDEYQQDGTGRFNISNHMRFFAWLLLLAAVACGITTIAAWCSFAFGGHWSLAIVRCVVIVASFYFSFLLIHKALSILDPW